MREEKAAKQHVQENPEGDVFNQDSPLLVHADPAEATKDSTKRRIWLRLRSPMAMLWYYNLALIVWIGYAVGGYFFDQFEQKKLAEEVAFRVSRFTGEIAYLERLKNIHADLMLSVGEAPYLMRGELHLLWETPPADDVAFLWQNDHFARERGVVVVSRNRDLLQRVDALLDDGDLGNGTAQMHPRGLWVSLH